MAETETQATAEAPAETSNENLTENKIEETATQAATTVEETPAAPEVEEEISYHAVEKEGKVTALWEMQGRKHLRTIDPRSNEGKHILSLFTSEHHEEAA